MINRIIPPRLLERHHSCRCYCCHYCWLLTTVLLFTNPVAIAVDTASCSCCASRARLESDFVISLLPWSKLSLYVTAILWHIHIALHRRRSSCNFSTNVRKDSIVVFCRCLQAARRSLSCTFCKVQHNTTLFSSTLNFAHGCRSYG